MTTKREIHLFDVLWDAWCILSVIGIWPRFIEPRLLQVTNLTLGIKKLPKELEGLKIVQFSDLHLNPNVSDAFLQKVIKQITRLNPDIIVFTGDFLCYSIMSDKKRLTSFLNQFQAPYGCFAVVGNHDYAFCVSVSEKGDYDIIDDQSSLIGKGFKRLFSPTPLTKKVTAQARAIENHPELVEVIKNSPFELLDNTSKLVPIKDSALNIVGVGEHMLGRNLPERAFEGYHHQYPGIILAHNPDCAERLKDYPGEIILSGHTHGAQVNLPWLWKKFVILENMQFKRGLFQVDNKWLYVNRGIGSTMPFRWLSLPEITLVTLERKWV